MKYTYVANLMRVVVLLTFTHQLRYNLLGLLSDLKDSFAILMTIFSFVLLFSLTMYYFYRPMF